MYGIEYTDSDALRYVASTSQNSARRIPTRYRYTLHIRARNLL